MEVYPNVEMLNAEKERILRSLSFSHNKPIWKQYLAAFLASLVSLSNGCVAGWSSPAIPLLMAGAGGSLGGIGKLTLEEASWVVSLNNMGALISCIPAGYISHHCGRKNLLLSLAAPVIIGWLCIIYNCNNVSFLYVGRILCGLSYGSLNVALPMYNNEISMASIRGRCGILYDLTQCLGLLYVYWLGSVLSLFWCTVMCLMVPVIFFCTFIWMPESPVYLVRKGKIEEAVECIKWLHGDDCNIDLEIFRIEQSLLEGRGDCRESDEDCGSPCSFAKNFYNSLSKVTIKAFLIAFFMFVWQRTAGATMIQYYTVDIFQMAHSSINPNMATIITGVVQVFFSFMSIFSVDTVGRRVLLISTFFIMASSMLVFLIYLAFASAGSSHLQNEYGWIPTMTLCTFIGMFRLGVSPVPWFMAPEIIPIEAQRWALPTIVCITWGTSFLLSKCFLPAVHAYGQITVYTFFFVVCVVGFAYSVAVVPETKNKSREEIQRELMGASNDREYEIIS